MQYGYQQIGGSALDISSVMGSLPIGPLLGDEKVQNGITYRLVYNAGNSQASVGRVVSPTTLGGGLNSVTVSTASDSRNHIGAGVVYNATAATNTYFWMAIRGVVNVTPSAVVSAGKALMIGANGIVTSAPSLPTEMVGNASFMYTVASGNTAGAPTCQAYINFY